MKSASIRGALLLAATCIGCSTSSSGGLVLFPLPYKLLPETEMLKSAHPNPVVWPRELAKNVTGPAVAEPGDLLSIAAVDPAARVPFVGEQPIILDGTIDLGKYGRVIVGYKTLGEIEAIINAALRSNGGRDLAVTVRFARAPESKRVYVLGDVVTPGSYPINGNETVLDVILLAGGLTRKADERNIILSRPTPVCDCRVVVPVCHEAIVQWGDTSTNYQVLPGDRIYVPTLGLCNRIFGKLKPQCPPCNAFPSPCALPEEQCNGCATGAAKPVGAVVHDKGVTVEMPAVQGPAPVAPPVAAPPAPVAPPPAAPRLEEKRLPPPPQTLRETPRDASALPRSRLSGTTGYEPSKRPLPELSRTTLLEPSLKTMGTSEAVKPMPETVKPMQEAAKSTQGAWKASSEAKKSSPEAPTKAPELIKLDEGVAKPASATQQIKEPAAPTTDWQSPWRPASHRTDP